MQVESGEAASEDGAIDDDESNEVSKESSVRYLVDLFVSVCYQYELCESVSNCDARVMG